MRVKSQDSTRSIAKGAKHFFSGTLISRVTGLAREVAMAAAYGTNPLVAAFWMAFRFSHLLRRLFGEGALHAAFVPHFEGLRKDEPALGARFFYDLSMGVALTLLLLTLVIEALLGGMLLFGEVSPANQDVLRLTMILLPTVIFISLYALNTSLLNCEQSFFLPSVAPSVLNLLWIGAIFIFWSQPMAQAIEYLSMALVLAFALQWVVTLPKVYRYLLESLGERWRENMFSGREMVRILRPFLLGMAGVAAAQVNSALDSIFARAADPEGPAYLWYAIRIQQLPLALFGVGLTGALLPPIARAIQNNEEGQYRQFIQFALKRTLTLLIPMTAALFVLGFSGINMVYGRGEFSQSATLSTTYCLWAYGVGLIPMTLVLVFASAFYARKDYKTPMLISLFSVVMNVTLNALFVFLFLWGPVSIALATTLSSLVNVLLLGLLLKGGVSLQGLFPHTLKILLATLFAVATALLVGHTYFQDNTLLWLFRQPLHLFPRELLTQLTTFLVQALTFTFSFLLAAYLLRLKEFFTFLSLFRKPAENDVL